LRAERSDIDLHVEAGAIHTPDNEVRKEITGLEEADTTSPAHVAQQVQGFVDKLGQMRLAQMRLFPTGLAISDMAFSDQSLATAVLP
jgi:hypothetical protein